MLPISTSCPAEWRVVPVSCGLGRIFNGSTCLGTVLYGAYPVLSITQFRSAPFEGISGGAKSGLESDYGQPQPDCNRRALFQRRPGLADRLAGESASRASAANSVVARRAMACEFSIFFPAGTRSGVDAGCAALDEVERLEGKLSIYRQESDLSFINRYAAEAPVRADAEVYRLLRSAAALSAITAGAFDTTCGALVKSWGFFQGPRRVPSDEERRRALAVSGWRQVRFNDAERTIQFAEAGVEFNLGGIGKGYAIDRALHMVRRDFGIRCALMQGGQSSLAAIGAPPGEPRGWPVAIGDPLRQGQTLASVWLRDRALGTSGVGQPVFHTRMAGDTATFSIRAPDGPPGECIARRPSRPPPRRRMRSPRRSL